MDAPNGNNQMSEQDDCLQMSLYVNPQDEVIICYIRLLYDSNATACLKEIFLLTESPSFLNAFLLNGAIRFSRLLTEHNFFLKDGEEIALCSI